MLDCSSFPKCDNWSPKKWSFTPQQVTIFSKSALTTIKMQNVSAFWHFFLWIYPSDPWHFAKQLCDRICVHFWHMETLSWKPDFWFTLKWDQLQIQDLDSKYLTYLVMIYREQSLFKDVDTVLSTIWLDQKPCEGPIWGHHRACCTMSTGLTGGDWAGSCIIG